VASISRAPMLTSARWLAWQHVAVRDHIVLKMHNKYIFKTE